MPVPIEGRTSALAVLRQRPLLLFVTSRFFSGLAVTLLRATISWQVYEISQSAFHLGLVGLVQFVPVLFLNLVGGASADAWDRKRLAMLGQILPACSSVALVWTSLRGEIGLPLLYGLVVVVSVSSSFENPARSALLPQLVERSVFPQAVTAHSAIQMGAFMSGPVVMGFAIAAGGVTFAYLLHALAIAVSLLALAFVRVLRPQEVGGRVTWAAIREGLSFVRREPVVLGCMTLDMFAVLFGGATALLPIYATDILGVGARGYGFLASALEMGSVLMAVVMLTLPPVRRQGRALLWAVVAFGATTILFGLSRSFPLSLVAYMGAGMADYLSAVMRSTTVQLSTPDRLRGRVSAVNMIFIGASNQLGAAESGFVAALSNPTFSVVSGGVGALIAVAVIAWMNPALRRYATG